MHVKLEELTEKCGEWLRGSGPQSDIVISSRIRLARNLAEFSFVRRAGDDERAGISKLVRQKIEAVKEWENVLFLDVDRMDEVDRQFLVERQLMSRELADAEGSRGVAIDLSEKFSVMVNEEDHLRIQVMRSGLDIQSAWDTITLIDDLLEKKLTYAFHDTLGT